MPNITTVDLFSIEVINNLIVDPLYTQSGVLPYTERLDTSATVAYLATVDGGGATWVGELDPLSDAGVLAKELQVRPKKVGAVQNLSSEARADANAANIVGRGMVDALAAEVDAAFALGSGGADAPTGLPGVVGVNDLLDDPATLTAYVDAAAAIQRNGGSPSVIWISPDDWAALQKLPSTVNSNVPALQPLAGAAVAAQPVLYGMAVSVLPALPAGTAWVADGQRIVTVQRTPATLAASDAPLFNQDGYSLRVTMRIDWGFCYPKSITKIHSV